MDRRLRELDESIKESLLNIPNTPNEHIAIGKDENDNVEIRHLQPRIFDFALKAHWDLGVELDILDFERAVKITGSRFSMFKGLGAKLARALIQFMLDTNTTEGGYTEISPPFMVNRKAMTGTGQLPKFEFDILVFEIRNIFWCLLLRRCP